MKVEDYYRNVLVPGNVAMSAIRRAGLFIDQERTKKQIEDWGKELVELEKFVEGEALKAGVVLKYSDAHAPNAEKLREFLYTAPRGLGLKVSKLTPTKLASTDDDALMEYASLGIPRDDDHPIVKAVLKIRSISKARSTHLMAYLRAVRSDGAIHPKFNWTLKTSRISADDPPVHQIPERADKDVADKVKAVFVPRINPPPVPEDWDPRIHGSCFRWDISGAEAAIRAAMLTFLFCSRPDPVAWEYVRLGKDLHSKTASLIYGVPDGTYKKGTMERDAVGKQTFFAKQYGAKWKTVQSTIRQKARIFLSDEESIRISDAWDAGYPGLVELYEIDKMTVAKKGYVEDGYGRRRKVDLPEGVTFRGMKNGKTQWDIKGVPAHLIDKNDEARRMLRYEMDHRFHVAANTPTQSMSASDAFWMLAYLNLGEYYPLALPPMWEDQGLAFPEAADWVFHGGPGPGGKPFQVWHSNAVHDSGWGDFAPGRETFEAVGKTIWRRCRAIPFDWRIKADVPYRVELKVGPNMSQMFDYNKIATKYGWEVLPE